MFQAKNIKGKVYYVGVNDRKTQRFENMWPLPHGVSYNSYLIMDEKVALVDTVEIGKSETFLRKIESTLKGRTIDYLIVNHMEPDHGGSIRVLLDKYPNIKVIGNKKTFGMIEGYFGLTLDGMLVKDGDSLDLGHHKLNFYLAPMVHWPEVMVTYDATDKILFSADAFGTFGTLDGNVIDKNIHLDHIWDEMRRYYSNIVGKYGSPVQKALNKLGVLDVEVICSLHGPVWTEHRAKIIELYDKWSRYEPQEGVVIAYGSMYGNTEEMAEAVGHGVSQGGIKDIVLYDVSNTHVSYLISDVFKYRALIVGSPTYSNELLPDMKSFLDKIETRSVKNRIFGYFGSFTWAGAAMKHFGAFADRMKWEVVGTPVEQKMALNEDKYNACVELGKAVAAKLLAERN